MILMLADVHANTDARRLNPTRCSVVLATDVPRLTSEMDDVLI